MTHLASSSPQLIRSILHEFRLLNIFGGHVRRFAVHTHMLTALRAGVRRRINNNFDIRTRI